MGDVHSHMRSDEKESDMTCRALVTVIVVLAALLTISVAGSIQAQVRVDVGIHLPAPPAFVVIPGMPVYYAPSTPANVFFYAHQYWAFESGGWYVGPSWNGPWAGVAPMYVPAPILQVPVGYYRVPPPHWRGQRRGAPPPLGGHLRARWRHEDHEREWP